MTAGTLKFAIGYLESEDGFEVARGENIAGLWAVCQASCPGGLDTLDPAALQTYAVFTLKGQQSQPTVETEEGTGNVLRILDLVVTDQSKTQVYDVDFVRWPGYGGPHLWVTAPQFTVHGVSHRTQRAGICDECAQLRRLPPCHSGASDGGHGHVRLLDTGRMTTRGFIDVAVGQNIASLWAVCQIPSFGRNRWSRALSRPCCNRRPMRSSPLAGSGPQPPVADAGGAIHGHGRCARDLRRDRVHWQQHCSTGGTLVMAALSGSGQP